MPAPRPADEDDEYRLAEERAWTAGFSLPTEQHGVPAPTAGRKQPPPLKSAVPPQVAPLAKSDRRCPHCSHWLPPQAVLCVDCGYDLRTGMQAQARHPIEDVPLDLTPTWVYGSSLAVIMPLLLGAVIWSVWPVSLEGSWRMKSVGVTPDSAPLASHGFLHFAADGTVTTSNGYSGSYEHRRGLLRLKLSRGEATVEEEVRVTILSSELLSLAAKEDGSHIEFERVKD